MWINGYLQANINPTARTPPLAQVCSRLVKFEYLEDFADPDPEDLLLKLSIFLTEDAWAAVTAALFPAAAAACCCCCSSSSVWMASFRSLVGSWKIKTIPSVVKQSGITWIFQEWHNKNGGISNSPLLLLRRLTLPKYLLRPNETASVQGIGGMLNSWIFNSTVFSVLILKQYCLINSAAY